MSWEDTLKQVKKRGGWEETLQTAVAEPEFDFGIPAGADPSEPPIEYPSALPKESLNLWQKTKRAWDIGGKGVDLDFQWRDVKYGRMTKEQAEKNEAEFHKKLKENPLKAKNWLENIYLKTVGIAHPMASGEVKGLTYGLMGAGAGAAIIPAPDPLDVITVPTGFAVGHTVGALTYWAEQGEGSIYRDAIKAGLSHETASTVSSIGGPIYGAIEFSQVEKLIPKLGGFAKRTVLSAITGYLKRIGAEVLEEGEQKLVTEGAVKLLGKALEGKIALADVPDTAKEIGLSAIGEMKEAVGPMTLLALPGGSIDIGKAIITKPEAAPEVAIEPTPIEAPPAAPVVEPPTEAVAPEIAAMDEHLAELGRLAKAEKAKAAKVEISSIEKKKIMFEIRDMTPEEIAEDEAFWKNFDQLQRAVHVPTIEAIKDTLDERINLLEKVKQGILTKAEADILTRKFAEATKLRIETEPTPIAPEAKPAKESWEVTIKARSGRPKIIEFPDGTKGGVYDRGVLGIKRPTEDIARQIGKTELTAASWDKRGLQPEDLKQFRKWWAQEALAKPAPAVEEVEPEVEIRDLSDKTRKKVVRQTEDAIRKHDIYQVEAEAAEEAREFLGTYYISPKFKGELNRAAGPLGSKGFKAALHKRFTFDPEKGKPWDEAAMEYADRTGTEQMNIDDFIDRVARAVEAQKMVGKLNEQALNKAIASGDPYLELLAMKWEMLKDGLSAKEINDNIREQAEHYGLSEEDFADQLVPVERVEHVEKKPTMAEELARKGRKAKAKLSPEQTAILKAQKVAQKTKRPMYVYKKQGRFTVSKNLPTSGIYTKIRPPATGEVKTTVTQEKIPPRKRIKVEVRKPDEPPAVSRVEKPTGKTTIVHFGPSWYEANAKKQRRTILSRLSVGKKAFSELGRAIWSSSSRLHRIAPELFRATRKYTYDVITRTGDMTADAEPFIKATRKMSKLDWRKLDLALKNSDKEAIQELVAKYHLETEYDAARDVLNELYEAGNEVGIDIEYRKDYWPRILSDTEGFLQYFYQRDDWSIIEEAIRRRAKRAGRTIEELTDDEKAQVINTLLRGYRTQALTLARPGAAKERTVEIIDRELNQFYDDSRTALLKYIRILNTKIAAREFFGRETREITKLRGTQSVRRTRLLKLTKRIGLRPGATETKYKEHISKTREVFEADEERLNRLTKRAPKDTIGGYTYDLVRAGKIKPRQEREIQQILQGIFDPHRMSSWMGYVSSAIYLDTLNSPLQALTQLDEFAYSFYRAPLRSIPVAIRTAFRRSKIKPADIGIKSIGHEFQGPSMQRALALLLKATGFELVDRLNKENYINTILSKYQAQAKKKTPSLTKRLVRVFGKDYKNVLEDLRKPIKSLNDVSDNVKYLLFNEILDIQPVAISEMPEAYNKAGNLRILYTLKTFYIKRVDFIRNECFSDMKSPKTFTRGLSKLIWLAFAFALLGAGSDFLKDFIKGRAFDLKDSIVDNMLRMGFFSKYQAWRTAEKGLGTAVLEGWRPPTKAIDAITRDIVAKAQGKERGFEIWRSVPIVGELYYWWFGRGREKIEAKKTTEEVTW